MYFRVNLKMEKPMLLFYVDSIYWTKFQSCISVIKETWDYRFEEIEGESCNGWDDFEIGGLGPLYRLC